MEPSGGWSTTEIAGHACDVYQPARPHEHGDTIVYLHGLHASGLLENAAFTGQFQRLGLRVVAPRSGASWWTDRPWTGFDRRFTAEKYVLDEVLPWVAAAWGTRPPGIALLGADMGGQGALRIAFRHPNSFPIVAAIAPVIDYDRIYDDPRFQSLRELYSSAEAARQDTATLHVHPLNWPRNIWFCAAPIDWTGFDSADKLRMKLSALGIPHELDLSTESEGDYADYCRLMAAPAIEFVVERLQRERMRVG